MLPISRTAVRNCGMDPPNISIHTKTAGFSCDQHNYAFAGIRCSMNLFGQRKEANCSECSRFI